VKISIIIPTLNEAEHIDKLLTLFQKESKEYEAEILVVDGGSIDGTRDIVEAHSVRLLDTQKGRAQQLACGASHASGELFYFVHADTLPPKGCLKEIVSSVENGNPCGSYRFHFDRTNSLLAVNEFLTRLPFIWCRGGDQSLFVSKDAYEKVGGFDTSLEIMEDYDLIRKLKRNFGFTVLPRSIQVSSRKYEGNSYFKVNLANAIVFTMYLLGFSQKRMTTFYRSILG